MILLDDVVEILDLAHHNWHVAAGVDRIDGRLVGTALVYRDFVKIVVCARGLVEEALRRSHVALHRQQKVDSLSLLVDGAIEILPDALDLDVGLIYVPAAVNQALVFAGRFLDERRETDRSPVD